MEIKEFEISGKKRDFFRYKDEWVSPVFKTYECGLGSLITMSLYSIDGEEVELYADVTVYLPGCNRNAGCQFIDINNNGADIIDWLEQNKFGKRTGNTAASGFCIYPEFDFYAGENFWKYKKISDEAAKQNSNTEKGSAPLQQKTIRELKKGEYFRLKDSNTAPVWIRGEYFPSEKKYNIYKFDDVNHEILRKGDTIVFVGFTF